MHFSLFLALSLLPTYVLSQSIAEIQGLAHFSPYDGGNITTRGIITLKDRRNFWIQDPKPDDDERTSEGILVFVPAANKLEGIDGLAVGDEVLVDGRVKEYVSAASSTSDLFLTEVDFVTRVQVVGKGTIQPLTIGKDGRKPPTRSLFHTYVDGPEAETVTPTSQQFFKSYKEMDVKNKGLDFYESLEGMLVTIKNPVVTGQPFSGSFWVLPDGGDGATGRNAAGGITMSQDGEGNDNNPEHIFIGAPPKGSAKHPADLTIGDFVKDITGVVTYERGMYKIIPTTATEIVKRNNNTMAPAPPTPTDEFSIGSYNMENLGGNAPPAKFQAIANQVVTYLGSPSILVASEIQDADGAADTGTTDATATINKVIEYIAAAGGPTYKAVWINPQDKTDGGQPGGNIRSVIFYNEAAGVTLSPGKAGTSLESVKIISDDSGKPSLTLNPGRIHPTDPAWEDSRKALVASFEISGDDRIFILANHFTSKGGSSSAHGAVQPPIQGGVDRRVAQATLNRNLAMDILAIDPEAKIVIAGDLNDFTWTTPVRTLLGRMPGQNGSRLYDLAEESLPDVERYSYNFDGQSQELDHIIVSDALFARLASFVPVHINTWGPFAQRVSDHDPQYARFKRGAKLSTTSTSTASITTTGIVTTATSTGTSTVPASESTTASTTTNPASITGTTTTRCTTPTFPVIIGKTTASPSQPTYPTPTITTPVNSPPSTTQVPSYNTPISPPIQPSSPSAQSQTHDLTITSTPSYPTKHQTSPPKPKCISHHPIRPAVERKYKARSLQLNSPL